MRQKLTCIYAIINTVNGRRYVGSTSDWKSRQSGHLSMLRRGVHENSYLQRSWTKHGETQFMFTIIERCEVAELHIREQHHLDACQPHVYNRGVVAACPARGVKWSEEKRSKLQGRKATQATRERLRRSWLEKRASRTHCRHGHKWTLKNTKPVYRRDGTLERRVCSVCRRQRMSVIYQRDKEARGPIVRKPVTLEARAALKAAWKARGGGHWKGKKFSEAHKANLREAWESRKIDKKLGQRTSQRAFKRTMRAVQAGYCFKGHPRTADTTISRFDKKRGKNYLVCLICRKERNAKRNSDYIAAHGPDPRRGVAWSEERKAAFRALRAIKPWSRKGQKHSEETRAKLRKAWILRKSRQMEGAA